MRGKSILNDIILEIGMKCIVRSIGLPVGWPRPDFPSGHETKGQRTVSP